VVLAGELLAAVVFAGALLAAVVLAGALLVALVPPCAGLLVAPLPAARVPLVLAAGVLLRDVLLGGCAMSSCPP
jgi:hypothetical protein